MTPNILDRPSSSEELKGWGFPFPTENDTPCSATYSEESVKNDIPEVSPVLHFIARGLHLEAEKPIGVRIWKEDPFYFVANDTLSIYASGKDRSEALNEFYGQVVYLYQHYRSLKEDEVIGLGRELKDRFARLFREI